MTHLPEVTGFDLRVMGLLLAQRARLHVLSCGLLALAGLWITLAAAAVATLHMLPAALLLCSVAAGLCQGYYAARIGFDAALLDASADAGTQAAAMIDRSLLTLGLLPAARCGRDWAARWQGMRALCRGQGWALLMQLLLFSLACLLSNKHGWF